VADQQEADHALVDLSEVLEHHIGVRLVERTIGIEREAIAGGLDDELRRLASAHGS
jgi:hypothetical protein